MRLEVGAEDTGERLDRLLARRLTELSRSRAQGLIEAGSVRIDDELARKASRPVGAGQIIQVAMAARSPNWDVTGEDIPLDVLYEDAALAIINKPAGMVVHPAPGHPSGTLVNALLHRYERRLSALTDTARPGIVHRLDRGTSGVIVVALTDVAHQRLADQFADRTVDKQYLALTYGRPKLPSGVIEVAIGRDRSDRKKISANTNQPRDARTRWSVEEDFPGPGLTLMRAFPKTGRTHQVRAHLSHIHHPIVGDKLYTGKQWKGIQDDALRRSLASFGRPALHAHRLAFAHPDDGRRMQMETAPPDDMTTLLDDLRQARGR